MKKSVLLLVVVLFVLSLPRPAVAATPTPVVLQSVPLCGPEYTPKYDGDFPEIEKWDGVVNAQVHLLNAGRFIVTATLPSGTLVHVTGCANSNEPGIEPNAYYQVSVLDGRFVGLTGWVQISAVARK